jgi:hypothetical protein
VSGAAPQPNYARRLAFVTFLGSAAGSCLGSLLFLGVGSVFGVKAGGVLLVLGVLGLTTGSVCGWWFVLQRAIPPRFNTGLVLVAIGSLLFSLPFLLLVLLPLAWVAAGFAGLLTLKYLERDTAAE